jgi:hypothetical protein
MNPSESLLKPPPDPHLIWIYPPNTLLASDFMIVRVNYFPIPAFPKSAGLNPCFEDAKSRARVLTFYGSCEISHCSSSIDVISSEPLKNTGSVEGGRVLGTGFLGSSCFFSSS